MPSVAVIGAGLSGLITAKTLLDDGFDVQVFTRDESVGGTWCRKRAYPGLYLNNVHGEYHFSSLPMPLPRKASSTGGRLRGEDVTLYLESFADTFLKGKIVFSVEILDAAPADDGWAITLQYIMAPDAAEKKLRFDKIVVCTGGASRPNVPKGLSASIGRFSGPVFHSQQLKQNMENIVALAKGSEHPVCVIGGGRSAQDAAAYFANNDIKVCMAFDTADAFIATPIPLPAFIRKSRILSIFAGCPDLNSRLERFLHTTKLGSLIVKGFWGFLHWSSLLSLKIPSSSPLNRSHSAFWSIRINDEGAGAEDNFYSNLHRGKIQLLAPAHVRGFGEDGATVELDDGRASVQACAVVLATGYTSSWSPIFTEETRQKIGLDRQSVARAADYPWPHLTIHNPPSQAPDSAQFSHLYRGLVPVASLEKRNFAVNGAVFSANPAHTWEASAHWISSYFLEDSFLKLPSIDQATRETERQADFMRKRHPTSLAWVNESYSSGIACWTWPQYIDQLLADMGVRSGRSGGNWLTWPFKVVSNAEIGTLREERRAKRLRSTR